MMNQQEIFPRNNSDKFGIHSLSMLQLSRVINLEEHVAVFWGWATDYFEIKLCSQSSRQFFDGRPELMRVTVVGNVLALIVYNSLIFLPSYFLEYWKYTQTPYDIDNEFAIQDCVNYSSLNYLKTDWILSKMAQSEFRKQCHRL